jgi:hypothetical protein
MLNTIAARLLPCVCPASLIHPGANGISYTVCVDSTFGNDSTAKVESVALKFQTLPAAVAALVTAQAVRPANQVWVCLLDPGVYGPVNLNGISNIDFVGTTQDSTVIGPVTVTGGNAIHYETLTLISNPTPVLTKQLGAITNTSALTATSNNDITLKNVKVQALPGTVQAISTVNTNLTLRRSKLRGAVTTATGVPPAYISVSSDGTAIYNHVSQDNDINITIDGPSLAAQDYNGTTLVTTNSVIVTSLSDIIYQNITDTAPVSATTFVAKTADVAIVSNKKVVKKQKHSGWGVLLKEAVDEHIAAAAFTTHSDIHMSQTAYGSTNGDSISTYYVVKFDVVRTISLHGHNVTFAIPCSFTSNTAILVNKASAASNTAAIANGMNASITCGKPFTTSAATQSLGTTAFAQLNVPAADYAVKPNKTTPVSQTNSTGSVASTGSASFNITYMDSLAHSTINSTPTDNIANVLMTYDDCYFTLPPSQQCTKGRIIEVTASGNTFEGIVEVSDSSGDNLINGPRGTQAVVFSVNSGTVCYAAFINNGVGGWVVTGINYSP